MLRSGLIGSEADAVQPISEGSSADFAGSAQQRIQDEAFVRLRRSCGIRLGARGLCRARGSRSGGGRRRIERSANAATAEPETHPGRQKSGERHLGCQRYAHFPPTHPTLKSQQRQSIPPPRGGNWALAVHAISSAPCSRFPTASARRRPFWRRSVAPFPHGSPGFPPTSAGSKP